MTPDALDYLTPEERHRFYKMLGLKATIGVDGTVELDGTFIVDGRWKWGGRWFYESRGFIEVCPHGRPIVKRVRLADLLHEFGRV